MRGVGIVRGSVLAAAAAVDSALLLFSLTSHYPCHSSFRYLNSLSQLCRHGMYSPFHYSTLLSSWFPVLLLLFSLVPELPTVSRFRSDTKPLHPPDCLVGWFVERAKRETRVETKAMLYAACDCETTNNNERQGNASTVQSK